MCVSSRFAWFVTTSLCVTRFGFAQRFHFAFDSFLFRLFYAFDLFMFYMEVEQNVLSKLTKSSYLTICIYTYVNMAARTGTVVIEM